MEKREMPEGTNPGTGACRFCGQTRLFPDGGSWSAEELDEAATGLCSCAEAQREREKEKRTNTTLRQISEIFAREPEIEELMTELIPVIMDGLIRKVTVETEDGVKAAVWMSRDKINVNRKKLSNRTVTI